MTLLIVHLVHLIKRSGRRPCVSLLATQTCRGRLSKISFVVAMTVIPKCIPLLMGLQSRHCNLNHINIIFFLIVNVPLLNETTETTRKRRKRVIIKRRGFRARNMETSWKQIETKSNYYDQRILTHSNQDTRKR